MEHRLLLLLVAQLINFIYSAEVPKGISGNWKLVFDENFSGGIDKNWIRVQGPPPNADLVPRRFSSIAPGLSYYVPENVVKTTEGVKLTVEKKVYNDKKTYQATGGKMLLKYPIKYGYINVKLKLPWVNTGGRYYIGLNAENQDTITICEAINDKSFYSHSTKLRSEVADWEWLFTGSNGFTTSGNFPYYPHLFNDFAVHWGYQNVTYYVNGKSASFDELLTKFENAFFKTFSPFPVSDNLLLEISNSLGNWGGYPNEATAYPFDMLVESVQVFQDENFEESRFNDKTVKESVEALAYSQRQQSSENSNNSNNSNSSSNNGNNGNNSSNNGNNENNSNNGNNGRGLRLLNIENTVSKSQAEEPVLKFLQ